MVARVTLHDFCSDYFVDLFLVSVFFDVWSPKTHPNPTMMPKPSQKGAKINQKRSLEDDIFEVFLETLRNMKTMLPLQREHHFQGPGRSEISYFSYIVGGKIACCNGSGKNSIATAQTFPEYRKNIPGGQFWVYFCLQRGGSDEPAWTSFFGSWCPLGAKMVPRPPQQAPRPPKP